jgi:7-cyano-7-deazaguanine synthase
MDYSGYPDCRPEFYRPLAEAVKIGTKTEAQKGVSLLTPIIRLKKSEIIKLGSQLGVPFALTWSCYKGGEEPCGECDACVLRKKGFDEAGLI